MRFRACAIFERSSNAFALEYACETSIMAKPSAFFVRIPVREVNEKIYGSMNYVSKSSLIDANLSDAKYSIFEVL